MAIFTSNKLTESIDEIIACEGYSYALGGNYDAIMESYDDDFAVIEAMHAFDLAELEAMKESAGETVESPVLEANLKDIWDKIKAFFVNLGKRLLAFFKSVYDFVVTIVSSGETFAKKYKERLSKLNLNGFTYEMYEYAIKDNFKAGTADMKAASKAADAGVEAIKGIQIKGQNAMVKLTKISEEMDSGNDKALAALRQKLSGTAEADKYTTALFNKFRKGGKKKSMSISSVSSYVEFLEKSTELMKSVKDAEKLVKDTINSINGKINQAAKEAETDAKTTDYASVGAKKAALMRKQINFFSSIQTIYTRYINAWSSATKEATATYKNVCYKAMQYKKA